LYNFPEEFDPQFMILEDADLLDFIFKNSFKYFTKYSGDDLSFLSM